MDNRVFDVFLEALELIFAETGIEVRSVDLADNQAFMDQVVTTIGIAGTVKGNFLLCTDYASANNIIKGMLRGVSIAFQSGGLGELQKTALGELANQITGRAVTLLSEVGVECGITPPIIITAERLTSHVSDLAESFSRVVRGPFGVLRLFIALSPSMGLEKTS
jgi:CheY-specific phosphatase CheX